MVLYSLHIYNRRGQCLFDRIWSGLRRDDENGEHKRLIFGMLFSLTQMSDQLHPRAPSDDGYLTLRTNAYALHSFETLSGYRFVLLTDEKAGDPRQALFHVYAQLFVELVVKSPVQDPTNGERFACPLFEENLDKYFETVKI